MTIIQGRPVQKDWFIFQDARAEVAFMIYLSRQTRLTSIRLRCLIAAMWFFAFARFTYAFSAEHHPRSLGAPHAFVRYLAVSSVYCFTMAIQVYFARHMFSIQTQRQLLGLESTKAWAQLCNHTLCMVVCILLHRGEVPIASPSTAIAFATFLHTFDRLRLTTLQYVDVLKCITYAFMLGQRLAHQPGSGWASDIVLTLLTSIALPGFIMACLECRQRTLFLRHTSWDAAALPPFFRRFQQGMAREGLQSWVGGASETRPACGGEPASAGGSADSLQPAS